LDVVVAAETGVGFGSFNRSDKFHHPDNQMFQAALKNNQYQLDSKFSAQQFPNQSLMGETPTQVSLGPSFPDANVATEVKPDNQINLDFWQARLEMAGYIPVQNNNGSMSFFAKDAKKGDAPLATVDKNSRHVSISNEAGQDTVDKVVETMKASGSKAVQISGNPSPEDIAKVFAAADKHKLKVTFANPSLEQSWNQWKEAQVQNPAQAQQSTLSNSIESNVSSSVATSTASSQSSSYRPSASSSAATSAPPSRPDTDKPASTSNASDLTQVNAKLNAHLQSVKQKKPFLTASGEGLIDWLDKNLHNYQRDNLGNYRHKDEPGAVAFSARVNGNTDHLELPSKNSQAMVDLLKMAKATGDVKALVADGNAAYQLWKQTAMKEIPLTVNNFTPSPEQIRNLAYDAVHSHPPIFESQKGKFNQPIPAAKDGEVLPKESKILCRLQGGRKGGALIAMPSSESDGRPLRSQNKLTWKLTVVSEDQLKKMGMHDKRQGYVFSEQHVVGKTLVESQEVLRGKETAKTRTTSVTRQNSTKGPGR